MKKMISLVLAVLMIAAMLTGCGSADSSDGILAVVTGPEPDTIDPALNSAVDGGTIIVISNIVFFAAACKNANYHQTRKGQS